MNIHCLDEISQALREHVLPHHSPLTTANSVFVSIACYFHTLSLFSPLTSEYKRRTLSHHRIALHHCKISFTSLIKQVGQDQNGFPLAKNGRQSFGCLPRIAGIIERRNIPHLRPYHHQDAPCSNQTIESTGPRPLCIHRYQNGFDGGISEGKLLPKLSRSPLFSSV